MASIPSPLSDDKTSVPGIGLEDSTSRFRMEFLLARANAAQRQAIAFDHDRNGPVLVLAGAGSGKTTVLASRLAYMVASGVAPDAITALTFTRDAALEMRERVGQRCREIGLGSAAPEITTFHGLAYGIIGGRSDGVDNWQRLEFSRPPRLADEEQRASLLATLRARLGNWVSGDAVDECLFAREEADPRMSAVRDGYLSLIRAEGLIAFGDMVPLALKLAREHPDWLDTWQMRHTHYLVDEFQDTSPDQLELMRLFVGNRTNFFIVGDDDQAIYSFRGADSRCLDAVFHMYPNLKVIKLEENYRSTAGIVAYANRIFADKPRRLRKILRPARSSEAALFRENRNPCVTVHATVEAQAEWMLGEMRRLRKEYNLEWADFAVLYRLNAIEEGYRRSLTALAGNEIDGIRFMTVHGSKGLQFPVVFFVGLEQGICPYREALGDVDAERLKEERRVFYVGVTRAESRLYLCSCLERKWHGRKKRFSPSMFLRAPVTVGIKSLLAVLLQGSGNGRP